MDKPKTNQELERLLRRCYSFVNRYVYFLPQEDRIYIVHEQISEALREDEFPSRSQLFTRIKRKCYSHRGYLNRAKRNPRFAHVSVTSLDEPLDADAEATWHSVVPAHSNTERSAMIRLEIQDRLGSISPLHSRRIWWYAQGYTQREIAEFEDVSSSTISFTIRRAYEQLGIDLPDRLEKRHERAPGDGLYR